MRVTTPLGNRGWAADLIPIDPIAKDFKGQNEERTENKPNNGNSI